MNYDELIDECVYRCYCYNRNRSPDIFPEDWAKVFSDATSLEIRYQEDLKKGGGKQQKNELILIC